MLERILRFKMPRQDHRRAQGREEAARKARVRTTHSIRSCSMSPFRCLKISAESDSGADISSSWNDLQECQQKTCPQFQAATSILYLVHILFLGPPESGGRHTGHEMVILSFDVSVVSKKINSFVVRSSSRTHFPTCCRGRLNFSVRAETATAQHNTQSVWVVCKTTIILLAPSQSITHQFNRRNSHATKSESSNHVESPPE